MGTAETKKPPKKILLKLEFDTAEPKTRLEKAAVIDRARGGVNSWAHRTLGLVADHCIAGLSIDETYILALKELARTDAPRAEKIKAAVAKAALDAARPSKK